MAESQRLRAVKPDEKPPAPRTLSVTKAAAEGSTRDLLVAMRDRIALDVENPNTQSRDLASLTKRLLEITNEIEAIDARELEEGEAGAVTPDDAWAAV